MSNKDLDARFYQRERDIRKNDKKASEQHGVVYTPVECVDFINRSVAAILEKEFGIKMDDPRVEVVDPFCGTGIFMHRAIEDGLVNPATQSLHQIELMPESARIAHENVPGVHTHCADTFTLAPDVDLSTLEDVE
jgi:predicted helicase